MMCVFCTFKYPDIEIISVASAPRPCNMINTLSASFIGTPWLIIFLLWPVMISYEHLSVQFDMTYYFTSSKVTCAAMASHLFFFLYIHPGNNSFLSFFCHLF